MINRIDGTKLLTNRDKDKLGKFNNSSYMDKMKLKESNPTKYQYLIHLKEQDAENKKVISHLQYRKSVSIYNKQLVQSINPVFFVTIKYVDNVAFSPERVQHLFEGIKYEITREKPYRIIHYIEMGEDGSFHSHLFLSSLKHKQKPNQMKWLSAKLDEFVQTNKYSIATGSDDNPSVLVELYDADSTKPNTRSHYVNKTSNRQYLSVDLTNSDITIC
jgi:hypothetical protein